VVLGAAFLLDLTVGEPPVLLHPVVWMGRAIEPLKRLAPRGKAAELVVGALYVLAITCGFAAASWLLLQSLGDRPLLGYALETFLLLSCFALRGLARAGQQMVAALEAGDLDAARHALRSLCSRDPSHLSESELAGATIESLTENSSDSVVAPLFYFALFGVPGALLYRAANTLDAMVGYRGRYEYLGKAAARLDDLLNLIPARLTALLLLVAGVMMRLPARRALRVYLRDRQSTESPNAGHPMAMAAGLLGVRLDKRDAYVLGRELGAPGKHELARAITLVRGAGLLAVLALGALLALGAAA